MKTNPAAVSSSPIVEPLESRQMLSVSLLASKANASELNPTTSGRGVFTFSRTGSKADALVVDYSLATAGTTAASGDYATLPGTITIAAGNASNTLVINPVADTFAGKTETLELALSSSSNYTINAHHANATVKIAVPHPTGKSVPTVSIAATTPAASESAPSSQTDGVFTVTRTGSTKKPLVINDLVDSSSSAIAGTDYTALGNTATIAAGATSTTITVAPIILTTVQSPRTVVVDLANGDYAISSTASAATVIITDNNTTPTPPPTQNSDWFVTGDAYRTSLSINPGDYARTDEPVAQSINFTQLLASQGDTGSLDPASIQVVETSADGSTEVSSTVPYQFDQSSTYDASSNASGTLTLLATGNTAANTTRYYQVYFNTATTYTAPTVTPQVTVTPNVTDASGSNSIEIQTASATYYVEYANGGIADIVDTAGNDWVSYNNTVGSAGTYHGVPNGEFHPGDAEGFTTSVVSQGPLVATVTATNSGNSITYQFYPNYVTATINQEQTPYTFLYEGTPGGSFNQNDTWAISDGTTGNLTQDMPEPDSDGNGGVGEILGAGTNDGEWAYFDSASAGKYIYFAHDSGTPEIDSYFDLDNNMTVFGFGRSRISGQGGNYLYTTAPETFTFGIANDSGTFSTNSDTINGQYRPVTATTGTLSTQSTSPSIVLADSDVKV